MAKSSPKSSPADLITDAIIARLEAGVRPWVKSWRPGLGGRPLRVTGEPYRGINCFWLWLVADSAGYAGRTWMTYKQAQTLGGQVREGERSQFAIFYKAYTKTVESPVTGDTTDEARRVLRSYAVFNVDQIDGLPAHFYPPLVSAIAPADVLAPRAQAFVETLPANIRHDGDNPYYDRLRDTIVMPPADRFSSRAFWAANLAHEAAHWTGHADRLDREFGKKFGDEAYACEEIVAEMAAALLGADLGLPTDHLDDHASYLSSWLRVLKRDNRAIMTFAAKAEAAAGFLLRATGLGSTEADAAPLQDAA